MVQSRVNSSIDFPNIKQLDPSDKNTDSIIYKVKINGIKLLIALGNKKDTYISSGVVYYPIYLINNDKVVAQIGLYEISTELSATVIGGDNETDIDKFNLPPLFYPYVNIRFLKKYVNDFDKKGTEEVGTEEVGTEEVGTEEVGTEEVGTEKLKDEDDDEEEEDKPIQEDALWIQTFMKSTDYNITGNEGGGDCLFIVISSALASVGINKSVADLRKILSENATEDIYEGYKNMFDSIENTIVQLKKERVDLGKENTNLKKQLQVTKDRTDARVLITQGEEIKKRYTVASRELKQALQNYKEFGFMKGVTTLGELKAKIHTSEFWGETWSISTLERILSIKLVIFSMEAFENGDLGNVLLCGQLNDDVLESSGEFTPRFYILTSFLGMHYELITYKSKKTLTFPEIPLQIKNLIIEKCLERNAGPYYIIPNFRDYARKLSVKVPEDIVADMSNDIYDTDTVFQFYSKSNKGPKPGKGSGEKISPDKVNEYKDLAMITDWRKKLSNFWEEPFNLDGKKWLSVENYYQGSKYKKDNPEVYNEFSLDSGSELSKSPVMAKGAGGKKGSFKGKRIIPKGIVIDPDFFKGRSEKTMEDAMMAKFSQNEDLKKLLLETKKAKLVHYSRGSPPIVFNDLMRVRRELSRSDT
jgi:predicted NAD-dependent protein-ADP-ribosyltransferase YbiA (DUF1768 family)